MNKVRGGGEGAQIPQGLCPCEERQPRALSVSPWEDTAGGWPSRSQGVTVAHRQPCRHPDLALPASRAATAQTSPVHSPREASGPGRRRGPGRCAELPRAGGQVAAPEPPLPARRFSWRVCSEDFEAVGVLLTVKIPASLNLGSLWAVSKRRTWESARGGGRARGPQTAGSGLGRGARAGRGREEREERERFARLLLLLHLCVATSPCAVLYPEDGVLKRPGSGAPCAEASVHSVSVGGLHRRPPGGRLWHRVRQALPRPTESHARPGLCSRHTGGALHARGHACLCGLPRAGPEGRLPRATLATGRSSSVTQRGTLSSRGTAVGLTQRSLGSTFAQPRVRFTNPRPVPGV